MSYFELHYSIYKVFESCIVSFAMIFFLFAVSICSCDKQILFERILTAHYLRFNLILSFCLRLCFPNDLFHWGFRTEIMYVSHFRQLYMPSPTHIVLFKHPNNIKLRVHVMNIFIVQFSHSFIISSFESKCIPQHLVLKCPQFMLLTQCKRLVSHAPRPA